MKILITGSEGMLGTDLCNVLKDEDLILTNHKTLDITKYDEVLKKFESLKPDIIVNCAAMTDVDGCESQIDWAYQLNGEAVKNLALATKEIDGTLVHISTDYVFKGDKTRPLREDDELGPESVYGKSKLMGEEYIQEILDKYFILRTAWLYGKNGPNFIEKMLSLSSQYDSLKVVEDQTGSPTFTVDLSHAIAEVVKSDKYGIYHVTNKGSTTWYDYSKLIFKKKGIDVEVNPVSSDEFAAAAVRPHYSVLSHEKWIENGFSELRDYTEALDEYLNL